MAIALVTSDKKQAAASGDVSVTSNSLDTTGANLIIAVTAILPGSSNAPVISDSKGNSWTDRTAYTSSQPVAVRVSYTIPTSVGSGHTFTTTNNQTSYKNLFILAFSGCHATTPYDKEAGSGLGSSSSPRTFGSVTPAVNGSVVIAAHGNSFGGSIAADGGFTYQTTSWTGAAVAAAVGYLIQTTAAAANPSWSWTGGSYNVCGGNYVFAPAAGGGAQGAALHHYRQQGMMRHAQPKLILPSRELITELPRRLIENRLAL